MKLIGIELRNYRSIGNTPVVLTPLKMCNFLVGQNNVGKSNVLKALCRLSNRHHRGNNESGLGELELHMRSINTPFSYKLWYEAEESIQADVELSRCARTSTFWFEIEWPHSGNSIIKDHSLARITEFDQSNQLLKLISKEQWLHRASAEEIRQKFLEIGEKIVARISPRFPMVHLVPEFRKIQSGDKYAYDGTNLVGLLARYHMPEIGEDDDQQKFDRIQEFTRRLLHLPKATLEISRENSTMIVKNDGLRLPITSFGTGVHELLILVTAVLSIENAICCIEEPEIHLHPRLQRELIDFLIKETNNQYVFSTHSPTFINAIDTSNNIQVFHLRLEDGKTVGGPVLQKAMGMAILRDLDTRASDLLQANSIIWIEGPSDRIYLQKWLELVAPDLLEGQDYVFMCYRTLSPLNIDAENSVSELVNVLQINRNMILIMDSDLASSTEDLNPTKKDLKQHCVACGGISWVTDGREIENYIPTAVIKRSCKDLRGIDIDLKLSPYESFGKAIDRALRKAGAKPINYDEQKVNYSRKFAQHFTPADIDGDLRKHIDEIVLYIRNLGS